MLSKKIWYRVGSKVVAGGQQSQRGRCTPAGQGQRQERSSTVPLWSADSAFTGKFGEDPGDSLVWQPTFFFNRTKKWKKRWGGMLMGFRACHVIPNTAPWHVEYLKLKEFEKTAEAGISVWPPSLPHPYSPKWVIYSSWERCLPYPQRKRAILISVDPEMPRRIQINRPC